MVRLGKAKSKEDFSTEGFFSLHPYNAEVSEIHWDQNLKLGLSETHGEQAGEIKDTLHWEMETLAESPNMQLFLALPDPSIK